MAFDKYSACPCGSGRKAKHCCSAPLVGELDSITRAIAGEQNVAAMRRIDQLLQAHPGKPCLLALKGSLLLKAGNLEAVGEVAKTLVQHEPANVVGLALLSVYHGENGEMDLAVERLQDALEQATEAHEPLVYSLSAIAFMFANRLDVLAAHAHGQLASQMGEGENERLSELLGALLTSSEIPLPMREPLVLLPPPDDFASRNAMQEAISTALAGCWRKSAEMHRALVSQHPDQPELWYNLGTLSSNLSRAAEAAEAWHRYAALDTVPRDLAIDAEVRAQLMSPEPTSPTIPLVRMTWELDDVEDVMEKLMADNRYMQIPPDQIPSSNDEPPPKGLFYQFDRPTPQDLPDGELSWDELPIQGGEVVVFGRQTDRAPRMVVTTARDEEFDQKMASLRHVLGEGAEASQETLEEIETAHYILSPRRAVPRTSPEVHGRLLKEGMRQALFDQWVHLPRTFLDGKTPADAAGDPQYEIRLLAALEIVRYGVDSQIMDICDELTHELGLTPLGPYELAGRRPAEVRASQLRRVDVSQLSDEFLKEAFIVAQMFGLNEVLKKAGRQILDRGMADTEEGLEPFVFEALLRHEPDAGQALKVVHEAQEKARSKGRSPAGWMLHEFVLHLRRGDSQEATRVLTTIQSQHIREPGIAQALHQLLVGMGLMSPNGNLPMPQSPPAGTRAGVPVAGGPQASQAPGGLWTPGSPAAPPSQPAGEKKSNLWLPGMD